MHIIKASLFAFLLLLSGCITIPLTPEAKLVRTITPAIAEKCQLLGTERSLEFSLGNGYEAVQNQLRNQAAKIGGNAIVIISQSQDNHQLTAEVYAEVYKCNASIQDKN